jgi:putative nucleotidyltransferase with HDIG domain
LGADAPLVRRENVVLGLSLVVFAVAAAVDVAVADIGRWDPALILILAPLVILADVMDVRIAAVRVSGAFLGLLLAAAILGPAQASLLAVASIVVDTVRCRPRRVWAAVNLAAFAVFPLLAGLVMHGLAARTGTTIDDPEFALVIVAGATVATLSNFLISAVAGVLVDGEVLVDEFRKIFIPLIPSEAAMVLLSSLIVFAYAHTGVVMLGMLVALFFLYIWLLRELLLSQTRAQQLDERGRQLASLQVGVLTAMLKTLALRDHMTARHSAAVARYARALAREAGCSVEEQELVHTAGLLHDIGKFIFPDRILLADSRLTDEDWEIVKCHPYQGAKIVRNVEGYGPVADIILGHHERIDGKGYPRGLREEQIPLLSRMISIADTYDVMTARDSYRKPVSRADAVAELRRVAGAQLDAHLVALFVAMVERGDLVFRHGDDADFDAELDFERRVIEYAAPRWQAIAA